MPELPQSPDFNGAREELDDLIRRHANSIGPQQVDVDGDPTGDPIPDVMLSHWCLVAAWIDPADGQCFITRCNPNVPSYQITGLLTEALDD